MLADADSTDKIPDRIPALVRPMQQRLQTHLVNIVAERLDGERSRADDRASGR